MFKMFQKKDDRIYPLHNITPDIDKMQNNLDNDSYNDRTKRIQVIKMLIIMAVPIVSLLMMTGYQLSRAVDGFSRSRRATYYVESDFVIQEVAEKLQVERGMTAIYLGSNKTNADSKRRLIIARQETFQIIAATTTWPSDDRDKFLASKSDALTTLVSYRQKIDNSDVDLWTSMQVYTNMSRGLIAWTIRKQDLPGDALLIYFLMSIHSQLLTMDIVGMERAIGSTMYTLCTLPHDILLFFITTFGEKASLRRVSFGRTAIRDLMEAVMARRPGLETALETLRHDIFTIEHIHSKCNRSKTVERSNKAIFFFNTFTEYMDALVIVRQETVIKVKQLIGDLGQKWQFELIMYSLGMSLVIVVCILSTFAFVVNVNALTAKLKAYAHESGKRLTFFKNEGEKAETLLYQMLPKVIAQQLKRKQKVSTEYFNCVTVYFSDIVGFTDMSTRSSPNQIIGLLNALYSLFDRCTEKYDVYKVETIGDAYMVASGVPERNGDAHAVCIAQMALEIRRLVVSFPIPHLPEESPMLRVGIHSGPCIAGVVGSTMPRYCLFGETVNIASRLEATGVAMKIQISSTNRAILKDYDEFGITERGEFDINDKCKMTCYWLDEANPHNGDN